MTDSVSGNKVYIGLNCIQCGTKRKLVLRGYNVVQSRWGKPELRPQECIDCSSDPRLQAYLYANRPSQLIAAEYISLRDKFFNRPTIFSTWLREAFAVLSFASEAEEMIGHAICALETISSWSEGSKEVSPAQHLEWSDQLIKRMRDSNAVDVSVLVGYVLHLLYHIHMAHWVTNVSLICSIVGMASASGLHLEPSTRRLSVWDSVPKSAHTLLARLFWYIRSLQCQIVTSWPVLLGDKDILLPLEPPPSYVLMSPHQLYTTVSLRLGVVHELRAHSNGDLSLDDISSLRYDLEHLARELSLQLLNIHEAKRRLALMIPLILGRTGLLILLGLVQGKQRPLEMIELVDAISGVSIDIHDDVVWLVSQLEQRRLMIPDVDIYVCWCLFAIHQVVTSQMDYLQHVNFPLAKELWETIAKTLRRAIILMAGEQPLAQLLNNMIQSARNHAQDTGSSASSLPISVNELLLDVFAERLEQAKRSSRFLENL